ncbi:MAG: MEDS domain-containing protein [Acidobacteria bacterium]|nr:MEDS domain-containing protein [Acidobacteriota bacterium]
MHATPASTTHTVQLYRTDDYLADDVSGWLAPALDAGGSAIVIATEPHRQAIGKLLQTRARDLREVAEQGRYLTLDADETLGFFMRDGWPDAKQFAAVVGAVIDAAHSAAKKGHRRVYAFGEMVTRLWQQQKCQAAMRLEQLWNELARTRSFDLRCGYPVGYFGGQGDGAKFLKLCGEHSHVIGAEAQVEDSVPRDRRRILSVSTNTRMLITRNDTLAVAGYSVASPKEPEEAAFMLATQPFDIVVIADSVRQRKRAALIPALRAIRQDVPIVYVHAGEDPAVESLADLSVDVSSGPVALIAALQKRSPGTLAA